MLIDTPGRQTGIVGVALAASTGVLVAAVPEGGPVAELATLLNQIRAAQALNEGLGLYEIVRMRIGGTSGYRRLAEEQTIEIARRSRRRSFGRRCPRTPDSANHISPESRSAATRRPHAPQSPTGT